MSWVEFFQNATRLVNKKINSKAMIVNFAPEYFIKLTKVVQDYNSTTTGKMYVYLEDISNVAYLLRKARMLETKNLIFNNYNNLVYNN